MFGRHYTLIKWISSFLSDRSIAIKVDGYLSKPHSINSGVPQVASTLIHFDMKRIQLNASNLPKCVKSAKTHLVVCVFTRKCTSMDATSGLYYLSCSIHPLHKRPAFLYIFQHFLHSLPSTTFPESYNLSSFKSNIRKLHLVSLST